LGEEFVQEQSDDEMDALERFIPVELDITEFEKTDGLRPIIVTFDYLIQLSCN